MIQPTEKILQDTIYATPHPAISAFRFDDEVVRVFPDMIARSVPGYELLVPLIGLWAARTVQAGTNVYDLGCSLGAATFAMRQRITQPDCEIIAVDNSPAMVRRCQEILAMAQGRTPVTLRMADVRDVMIENASLVVLNFTLQFIAPAERDAIIERVYAGLVAGGILILSEKVVFADAVHNERMVEIHHDFKRANGYSELEIAQKRTALEEVLIPETVEQHQARLLGAGFASAEVWFQAFNFVSTVGIKDAG